MNIQTKNNWRKNNILAAVILQVLLMILNNSEKRSHLKPFDYPLKKAFTLKHKRLLFVCFQSGRRQMSL